VWVEGLGWGGVIGERYLLPHPPRRQAAAPRSKPAHLGRGRLRPLAHGVPGRLQRGVCGAARPKHPERVAVGAAGDVAGVAVHAAVELVKDAVVLVEVA